MSTVVVREHKEVQEGLEQELAALLQANDDLRQRQKEHAAMFRSALHVFNTLGVRMVC